MADQTSRAADWGLLFLRVGAGLMLISLHGWGKLTGAYGNLIHGQEWGFIGGVASLGFPFATFFAVCAALSESVGALMLAAGLYTRYAAIPIGFTMLVATYRHVTTDMRFELAAVYLLIAVMFALVGPGRFSLDELLLNRAKVEKAEPAASAAG
ncbi:MAG TPA: DoxX family protein [Blastocatellia bacterium]|nr:DoxX family protein [Blastocatellia bacterium]